MSFYDGTLTVIILFIYCRRPLHIIFLTDGPGIMATRMLWFEVMPPFAIYNHIKRTASQNIQRNFDKDGGIEAQSDTKRVLRFQAEFVDIDIILDKIRNKTLTMQKYFNHPNQTFTYKENDADPMSVVYTEVRYI